MESEVLACGIKCHTCSCLENKVPQVNWEDIEATYHFLYTKGSIRNTADRMHWKVLAHKQNREPGDRELESGWSPRNASRRITSAINILNTFLSPWLQYDERIVNHPQNRTKHFDENVRTTCDTVPIPIYHLQRHGDEDFGGKYCEHILKMFTAYMSPALYSGRSGDKVIQDHSGFNEILQLHQHVTLSDCGFNFSAYYIRPYDKTEIWPTFEPVLKKKPWAAYLKRGDDKMRSNALVVHWRARAEHLYCANYFGRFTAFKLWRHTPDLAYLCSSLVLATLNLELYLDHGYQGRYSSWESAPAFPHSSYDHMVKRYGQPVNEKSAGKKRKREEPTNTLDAYGFGKVAAESDLAQE